MSWLHYGLVIVAVVALALGVANGSGHLPIAIGNNAGPQPNVPRITVNVPTWKFTSLSGVFTMNWTDCEINTPGYAEIHIGSGTVLKSSVPMNDSAITCAKGSWPFAYTFAAGGTYTVWGNVSGTFVSTLGQGTTINTKTATVSITVSSGGQVNPSIHVGYVYSQKASSLTVKFSDASTLVNVANPGYQWTWNDGSFPPVATGSVVNHSFVSNGTYSVTESVYGYTAAGTYIANQTTASVVVWPATCVGGCSVSVVPSFNWSRQPGTGVSFGSTSTVVNGTISTISWAFGDGTTATGSPVYHAYVMGGTYNVTMTITASGIGNPVTASVSTLVTVGTSGTTSGLVPTLPFILDPFDGLMLGLGLGLLLGLAFWRSNPVVAPVLGGGAALLGYVLGTVF